MARESRGTHALVSHVIPPEGPQRRCPTANGLRERGPVRRKILREYAIFPHIQLRVVVTLLSQFAQYKLSAYFSLRASLIFQRVAHEVFKCVVGIFLRLPIGSRLSREWLSPKIKPKKTSATMRPPTGPSRGVVIEPSFTEL